MKYLTMLCLCVLVVAAPLSAQSFAGTQSGFYAGFQYQTMNTDAFSAELEALEFSSLDNSISEVTTGYTFVKDRFMTNVGIYYGNQDEKRSSVGTTNYRRTGASIKIAYNLIKADKGWYAGPETQIDYNYSELTVLQGGRPGNLAAAFTTDYVKYTNKTIPIGLGVVIGKSLALNRNKGKNFIIILRGGYKFDDDSGWELDNAIVLPNFGIEETGVYGALTIGFTFSSPTQKEE